MAPKPFPSSPSAGRSPERRAAIDGHLRGLGLEFEHVDAVDGKLLSNSEMARISARPDLPAGAIGCYLSHIRLFERIVASGIALGAFSRTMVACGHPQCASCGRMLFVDFDICFLDATIGTARASYAFDKDSRMDVAPGTSSYTLSAGPHCTHAYLITMAGAKKRLVDPFPIRETIDQYESVPDELHFRAVLFPRPAFVSILSRASTIFGAGRGGIPLYRWRSARASSCAGSAQGRALERCSRCARSSGQGNCQGRGVAGRCLRVGRSCLSERGSEAPRARITQLRPLLPGLSAMAPDQWYVSTRRCSNHATKRQHGPP